MTTIVVAGAVANKYLNGGEAWVRLSWTLGFRKLGCRVVFIEEIRPENCLAATGDVCSFETSVNLAYFRRIMERFSLARSAALICRNGEKTHGLSWKELLDIATEADLLVNISGHLACPELLSRFRRKAYIDIDPGFTQFWHAEGNAWARLEGHDFYFTIGENIGTHGCSIPTKGIPWRQIRQPVVLEQWPLVPSSSVDPKPGEGFFTTVASWRGPYGSVKAGGKTFGLKVHEFRKFIELPRIVPQVFEIALDIHPADRIDLQALQENNWRLTDPKMVACDPEAFRGYVQRSAAEFSVAQGIYVDTNSGWFSDRTVRYLASGKPVLIQETGFSKNLPVGEGLVSFRDLREAVAGAASIDRNYRSHCRAARQIAETYFDSDKVLGRLLDEVSVAM